MSFINNIFSGISLSSLTKSSSSNSGSSMDLDAFLSFINQPGSGGDGGNYSQQDIMHFLRNNLPPEVLAEIDLNGDGIINPDEFSGYLQEKLSDQELRKILSQYDQQRGGNKDGKVSMDEFSKFLSNEDADDANDLIASLFYDQDGDEMLDEAEIASYLTSNLGFNQSNANKYAQQLIENNDGEPLSGNELLEQIGLSSFHNVSDEELQSVLYNYFDANGNGTIEESELSNMLQSLYNIGRSSANDMARSLMERRGDTPITSFNDVLDMLSIENFAGDLNYDQINNSMAEVEIDLNQDGILDRDELANFFMAKFESVVNDHETALRLADHIISKSENGVINTGAELANILGVSQLVSLFQADFRDVSNFVKETQLIQAVDQLINPDETTTEITKADLEALGFSSEEIDAIFKYFGINPAGSNLSIPMDKFGQLSQFVHPVPQLDANGVEIGTTLAFKGNEKASDLFIQRADFLYNFARKYEQVTGEALPEQFSKLDLMKMGLTYDEATKVMQYFIDSEGQYKTVLNLNEIGAVHDLLKINSDGSIAFKDPQGDFIETFTEHCQEVVGGTIPDEMTATDLVNMGLSTEEANLVMAHFGKSDGGGITAEELASIHRTFDFDDAGMMSFQTADTIIEGNGFQVNLFETNDAFFNQFMKDWALAVARTLQSIEYEKT